MTLEERIKNLRDTLEFIYPLFNKERSGIYKDMPELNYIDRALNKIKEALDIESECAK